MNETRTINLNGLVYHIDNDAYNVLHEYLQDIEQRLPQEDRTEVMADIEARVAELFQKALFAKNVQVVNIQMVQSVRSQIGEPSEFGPNSRPKMKENRSQNAGCGRIFSIVLNVVLAMLALPVIIIGLIILFAIVISFFGVAITGTTGMAMAMPLIPMFADALVEGGVFILPLLMVALILIVVLPIVMLVHTIVTYMRTRRGPKPRFWWITVLLWLASLMCWGVSLVRIYKTYDNAPQIFRTMTFDAFDIDEDGISTSALQLDAYHSVELRGAAELHLCNASEPSTTLTTNMLNLLMDIENHCWKAEVRDSILYIDVSTQLPLEDMMINIAIASPYLRKLTVYGASKIETTDEQTLIQPTLPLDLNGAAKADLRLRVQDLTIEAKGASQLELEGSADNMQISLAGAGEIEAEDLLAQVVHINCAGASKAEINVQRELWAQAAGASKITYKGAPRILQNMAIGGSVIRRDS